MESVENPKTLRKRIQFTVWKTLWETNGVTNGGYRLNLSARIRLRAAASLENHAHTVPA